MVALIFSAEGFLHSQTETAALREAMAANLEQVSSQEIAAVFAEVPRHRFISGSSQALSYSDGPVPLGRGRFLPSPGDLATMIAGAGDLEEKRVLVAGPESGYLTSLVSRLADSVVQIEFAPERIEEFSRLFEELGYNNIELRSGKERIQQDISEGYDIIFLAYGTDTIPVSLIARLNQTGSMIAVLQYRQGVQLLVEYRRIRNGASLNVLGRGFFPRE